VFVLSHEVRFKRIKNPRFFTGGDFSCSGERAWENKQGLGQKRLKLKTTKTLTQALMAQLVAKIARRNG
jgi:hypothetical protein